MTLVYQLTFEPVPQQATSVWTASPRFKGQWVRGHLSGFEFEFVVHAQAFSNLCTVEGTLEAQVPDRKRRFGDKSQPKPVNRFCQKKSAQQA